MEFGSHLIARIGDTFFHNKPIVPLVKFLSPERHIYSSFVLFFSNPSNFAFKATR